MSLDSAHLRTSVLSVSSLSINLLDSNPDDPLLYYNLAVVYQRLVSDSLDRLTIEFNNLMSAENANISNIESVINEYQIKLVGGDVTFGEINVCVNVFGYIDENILIRSNAKPGDNIYITGQL